MKLINMILLGFINTIEIRISFEEVRTDFENVFQ